MRWWLGVVKMPSTEKLSLIRFDEVFEAQYMEYILEWEAAEEKIVPSATNRRGAAFPELLEKWRIAETDEVYKSGFVPATLYFLVRDNLELLGHCICAMRLMIVSCKMAAILDLA